MSGDNDEDDGFHQKRRDLHSKLTLIWERANFLRKTIKSDLHLPPKTKHGLILAIADITTSLASNRADFQNQDILLFTDSILDTEIRLESLETRVNNTLQKKIQEELDFSRRNHHTNAKAKNILSQLDIDLINDKNLLGQRLQPINASCTYQEIKKYNDQQREKIVSTALTEITAYIDKRERNEKKPSELRKKKLAIAHSIRAELENQEKSAAQKIQAVDDILKDNANAKIFSKRGNVFKRGTENFLGSIKGFLKDNSEGNALCSYFFAPPRAAILQKSLENMLDPVLSKPKT